MDGSDAKGFALIRPPGHHAGRENPMGFCIFNNIAVTARYCQERHHLKKVEEPHANDASPQHWTLSSRLKNGQRGVSTSWHTCAMTGGLMQV